jgi:hypothetical protein
MCAAIRYNVLHGRKMQQAPSLVLAFHAVGGPGLEYMEVGFKGNCVHQARRFVYVYCV